MSDLAVLLSPVNVSEGRDQRTLEAIAAAFSGAGARLLDVHSDPDHDRSVFTLAAAPGALASALLAGAREAIARIDITGYDGLHPHVGALDVVPLVHLDDSTRGAACAEALVTADLLGRELDLPVLLYGALAGGRTRAELRRRGPAALARRIEAGELEPDFGPRRIHPRTGAALVAARPPLVAFNLELEPPATEGDAKRIASLIRDGAAEGLPGVRAIGLWLERRGVAQVSCNVEDHRAVPLALLVEAVRRRLPVAAGELVGLAPACAFDAFPADLPLPGFDPRRHLIEQALEP